MMIPQFPLERVTENDFQQLCQVLWSWPQCDECQNGKCCPSLDCPFKRVKRLLRFKEHYKDLAAAYEPDVALGEEVALERHDDLLDLIRGLRTKPDITRAAFADESFSNRPNRRPPPVDDQERVINLAVKVMAMVNCAAQYEASGLLEHGTFQRRWQRDVTFSQFMNDAFLTTDHPSLNDADTGAGLDMKSALMATKLKKQAGLKFRPTDDLRCHLRLNRKTGIVDIFHHTAFLKEHLRITKDKARPLSLEDCLKL
jgi:hypothetical protein